MIALFITVLTAVFVGLKLADVINWSWWTVTSPLWGSFAVAAVLAIIIGATGGV